MDPLTIGLIGAGALGYLGNQQAGQAQADAIGRANDIINAVPLPVLQKYYPELYKQVVELVPEAETAVRLGPSAMENVNVDPKLMQAQMNALSKLQEVGEGGGMTATDRARLARIQMENDAALKGQQGAIMQNLATRGLSGGMSEMVGRQLAAQEAANRQAQQGMDVKAQAEQRALDAIMQSGQLGGQIGQQQFAQQSQIAQAKDLINKFNAQNLQDVGSRNVQGRNQAQEWNAQKRQNVANQNVGLGNQAQMYNLNLPQQNFQNQLGRATGQATGITNLAQQQAQNQRDQMSFLGGLMQTGAQYYGGKKKQQEDDGWGY